MRDAEAARIACHDSTDPCRPWAGSACLLGEGYARRVAEGRAEALDRLIGLGQMFW